ncbi:hypothetical protein Tco_0954616 [Tanacetum coccineum]|uniref:Uncharacterized protein n=1 Tax=Tanacetum coccineum TaxID=301880 RepID=A0ABQ5E4X6_9ASTR
MFDEYFRLPPCVDHPVSKVAALVPAVSTSSPSSTSVDQDAPSPSTSQTQQESPSYVIPPGGGSFEITPIYALSTSSPALDTLCPSTIPSLTMK